MYIVDELPIFPGVVGACLLGALDDTLSPQEALDAVQRGYSLRTGAEQRGHLCPKWYLGII